MNAESRSARITCCSPATLCFTFCAAFIAWIPLTLASLFWRPLAVATVPLALAVGCFANWVKNRTLHCSITAPIFLVGGILLLLTSMDLIRADRIIISASITVGVAIALLFEWQYFARTST